MRRYLWRENDIPVQASKTFTHYSSDSSSVTAFFSDGSRATGTLLVGADGLHSRTLDQIVGPDHHKAVPSVWVPFFGEAILSKEVYEPIRKLSTAAILASTSGTRLQLGMLSMSEDRSTCRSFWALMCRRDDPSELIEWVQHAHRNELYEFVMETTKDWDTRLKKVFEFAGPEALAQPQPKFMEFVPPDELPRGRVVILGDGKFLRLGLR